MIALIVLCGGLAAFLLVTSLWEPLGQELRARYASAQGAADAQLRAASLYTLTPARLIQMRLAATGLAFVLGLALSGSVVLGLACAALGWLAPGWWVESQRQKRLQLLEEQLPVGLDQITASVRAGLSLAQAIDEASRTAPAPVSEEFGIVAREHKLGARLVDSIESAQQRIGGRFFPLFGTALRMNVERGGNLPEAMNRMSESFREIWRLEQRALTASAEARKAMRVIGAMPLVVGVLVFLLQPELVDVLTGSLAGWLVIVAVGVLYVAGLLWLKRLMSEEA